MVYSGTLREIYEGHSGVIFIGKEECTIEVAMRSWDEKTLNAPAKLDCGAISYFKEGEWVTTVHRTSRKYVPFGMEEEKEETVIFKIETLGMEESSEINKYFKVLKRGARLNEQRRIRKIHNKSIGKTQVIKNRPVRRTEKR